MSTAPSDSAPSSPRNHERHHTDGILQPEKVVDVSPSQVSEYLLPGSPCHSDQPPLVASTDVSSPASARSAAAKKLKRVSTEMRRQTSDSADRQQELIEAMNMDKATLAATFQKKKIQSNFKAVLAMSSAVKMMTPEALNKSASTLEQSPIEPAYTKTMWWKLVQQPWFNMFIVFVVVAHVLFLAVETDADVGTGAWSTGFYIDASFTVIYVAEMVLRVLAYRVVYFTNAWDLLDFSLVMLSIADLIVVITTSSSDPSLSVASSLRMIRFFRVARLVRLFRFFKQLWLLTCGIAASMRTAVWACYGKKRPRRISTLRRIPETAVKSPAPNRSTI